MTVHVDDTRQAAAEVRRLTDPETCGRCHRPRSEHHPHGSSPESRCDGYKYTCPSCGHYFTVHHAHRADCKNQPEQREGL